MRIRITADGVDANIDPVANQSWRDGVAHRRLSTDRGSIQLLVDVTMPLHDHILLQYFLTVHAIILPRSDEPLASRVDLKFAEYFLGYFANKSPLLLLQRGVNVATKKINNKTPYYWGLAV